jgi:hypothetical protein
LIYLAILLAIPALYKVQTYVLRLLNTSRFNKINLSKGEVEFDEKSESSVLNKHLDEILYFFEVTPYDIVVFEDLDRFNDPEIFTKLREINILINQSLQIGRRIVFIYAIKDDMFKDKTRTKFFDFIVPVIPVINYSNSYEIMVKKFGKPELKLNVSEKFISAITLYIDDMRALKNIFNEFMLYKENLKGIVLNEDKLLAVIVYKNIFPSDFADLHENKGIISRVFEQKPELTKNAILELDQLIAKNNNRMSEFKEPLVSDIQELRSIYLLAFQQEVPHAAGLVINNKQMAFSNVRSSGEDFELFTKSANIEFYQYVQSQYYSGHFQKQQAGSNVAFTSIEKNVNSELTYQDRYQLIRGESIAEIEKLAAANVQAETGIAKLKSSSLKELLNDSPESMALFPEDFKTKKLLVYLIREGYIDETYPSLVSYFYEGSLSFKDMSFILNIRNREASPFDYQLGNVGNVVKRLEVEDCSRVQVLNFQLTDYLLQSNNAFKTHLNSLFKLLASKQPETLKFIDEFIDKSSQKVKFFKGLFDTWPTIWDDIIGDLAFNPVKTNQYLLLIITYADAEQLKLLNKSKKLEKHIKSVPDFLNWFKTDEEFERVKKLIKLFSIKFTRLLPPEGHTVLFDFIIEQQFYMLTEDMIKLIIEQKGVDESQKENLIESANYTAVQLSGFEPLKKYVAENLSDYLESITLLLPANTKDSETQVINLLNEEHISEEIRERLIVKEEALIADIKAIPEAFWGKLLTTNKIVISWRNVIHYYLKTGAIDQQLIDFFNQKHAYSALASSKSNIDKEFDDSINFKFTEAYILEDGINDEAYDQLVNSIPYYYPEGLVIENLSKNKVRALIRKRVIRLVPPTFELIKTYFTQLLGSLVEVNFEDYLKSPATFLLDSKDFIYLLNSGPLLTAFKTSLLPQIGNKLLEDDAVLSNLFAKQILEDSPSFKFSSETLQILMQHGNLLMRRQLLNKYFKAFTNDEIMVALSGMGNDFLLIKPDGDNIELESIDLNISIARKLKQAGLISDVRVKKNKLTITNLKPADGDKRLE